MPSVVMNDVMPITVVMTPLISPIPAHPTRASRTQSSSGMPASWNQTTMNAAMAKT
jgi:hypothetical protein